MNRVILSMIVVALGWQSPGVTATQPEPVLLFSKTAGFRHGSIEAGIAAIRRLGEIHGFTIDATEDAGAFTEANLSTYAAVIFLNTTGDVLDDDQQAAFERYIRGGGAWVGVHSATDTEFDWPWYGRLAGAYFDGHPRPQEAMVMVIDGDHPATSMLPEPWVRTDEWYDFRSINPDINVLLALDESSYEGAKTGTPHPIAWYHELDGGRAFYTGGGHTVESYDDPVFLDHLAGGIIWALGR